MSLNPNEQAMVAAILRAARVPQRDITWMVESCPSVERARELYSRTYRHPPDPSTRSAEIFEGVKEAGERLRYMRKIGDEDAVTEAFARLQTEIAIVYWRIEQENAGIKLPELSAETIGALEALP